MHKLLLLLCNFIFGKHSNNTLPRVWILLTDMSIVIIAYILAVIMYYFKDLDNLYINWKNIWIYPIPYLLTFLITKTYDGLLRYSGFNDIRKILFSCTGTFVFFILTKSLFINFYPHIAINFYPPFIVIIYHYLIIMMAMTFLRLVIRRLYNERYKYSDNISNTIIYGAGDSGMMLLQALNQETSTRFRVKAFIDDNPKRIGNQINTIKILSPTEALTQEFINKNNIDSMIVAIPSISEERHNEVIDQGLALNLNVKSIPAIDNWVDGKFSTIQIQDIKIEDLLGHPPVIHSKGKVSHELKDKVILVTGAAGSIGNEICRQVMTYAPSKLIMLDQAESALFDFQFEMNHAYSDMKDRMIFIIADIRNPLRINQVFEKYHPQIVFHAAAYKHVPFMEENVYEAVHVNVFGTKNLADLSIKYNTDKFIMISTDKAVNPTNVMGASKRIAEIYIQSRTGNTKFITTRFGNVLISNGSIIPLFRKQIEQGGPITVTDRRATRYFITIPEACSLVLEASALGNGSDIFVFDMGEKVRIWELAEKMRQLTHHPEIEIIETGLRPGEKLYEEILTNEEHTVATDNSKIKQAMVKKHDISLVDTVIGLLHEALVTGDDMKIVTQMKTIVPEFKSNNSIFCTLDK